MSTKLTKLINLITVIQARPGIQAKELLDRCEIDERNLYRYLNDLSLAHIPIQSQGHSKGYKFIGNFAMYPLDLTEEEALAFAWLQPYFSELKDIPPSLTSAYDKIMATITKEKSLHKDLVERINEIFRIGRTPLENSNTNYFESIIQAMIEKRRIEATYHTQSRNASTKRIIDPYYLVPRENKFYLIAYCHLKNQIRTFRISRFKNIKLLSTTYDMKDFDINNYLKNTWSIERGNKTINFKVKFSINIARYIKEEELFVKPRIIDLPDGSILFEVKVNSDREFLQWLNQYGQDAEILEPKQYRQQQKERLVEWLKTYEDEAKG
jgi:predicted DNA-binding transcriptional regulator YafY